MALDPRIICFRHCCSKSIFCKTVPRVCPICYTHIVNYNLEPFLIPYPYKNAVFEPATIVIKPSHGNFLNDYDITKDLHIGIVNSNGIIFEYDKAGLIINDFSKWTNCIAVKIIPPSWYDRWDDIVKSMLLDMKWKSYNYNETTMNCFNFVIDFIQKLEYTNVKFTSKEDLCEKLLMSYIQDAVKYNYIFKSLKHEEYFISE